MLEYRLQQFLGPILGQAVAKKLILKYCAKCNKQPADLTKDDLPEIGRFLYTNIRVFVGSEQADRVLQVFVEKAMTLAQN